MLLYVCVSVCVGSRLQIHRLPASNVPLPSSLRKSPSPPPIWAALHSTPTCSQHPKVGAMLASGWSVKGCHGVAWAISLPQWSTETVLFLLALRLPQTGFSWFRSASIKPHAAVRPQIHTGRSSVPTSKETLQHFSPNCVDTIRWMLWDTNTILYRQTP